MFKNFPLPAILTIVFTVLKLTDVIAWSWVWVLSPMWIVLSFALVMLIIGGVLTVLSKWAQKNEPLSKKLDREIGKV